MSIPSHEDARHHTARAEAADQAIASLLGGAARRRFGPSLTLNLDAELLADIAVGPEDGVLAALNKRLIRHSV